jgi:hypothetical protein
MTLWTKWTSQTSAEYFVQQLAQYTLFLAALGTFSRKGHILGHKAILSKDKKVEITPCILSELIGIKLEVNSNRNYRKYSNTWRLNNTLSNDK